MTKPFSKPKESTDELASLEEAIRSSGAWCHKSGIKGMEHFYISHNSRSELAISLCMTIVTPMKNLSLTIPQVRCMTCDLFYQTQKEAQERHKSTVRLIADSIATPPNKQE